MRYRTAEEVGFPCSMNFGLTEDLKGMAIVEVAMVVLARPNVGCHSQFVCSRLFPWVLRCVST